MTKVHRQCYSISIHMSPSCQTFNIPCRPRLVQRLKSKLLKYPKPRAYDPASFPPSSTPQLNLLLHFLRPTINRPHLLHRGLRTVRARLLRRKLLLLRAAVLHPLLRSWLLCNTSPVGAARLEGILVIHLLPLLHQGAVGTAPADAEVFYW